MTATLARHAARTPARAALIVGRDRVAWRDLSALVERLAAHVAARTPAGAGVALHLPTGPALALLFLAAARAGREAQVLDPAWPAALTRGTLAALRPAMTITTDPRFASRRNAVLLADALPFARVAAALGAPARHAPVPPPAGDLPFYVGFTSGSTGTPKGYRRDHRSWVESFRGACRHRRRRRPRQRAGDAQVVRRSPGAPQHEVMRRRPGVQLTRRTIGPG